jgi:hypothetical protein
MDMKACEAVNTYTGWKCATEEHPGDTQHITVVDGENRFWRIEDDPESPEVRYVNIKGVEYSLADLEAGNFVKRRKDND